ncbi:inward rectifier potassium channel 2-like [Anoplophora glabripennis]|uniref:inward rectifier potassium channel 2-like n=1 Tax=Anoplophora glabripennis TaxID=217634 RepID=UPI0008752F6D|nr:inward rectifier potassium channel 2-like [Anoplophora glabripennis]
MCDKQDLLQMKQSELPLIIKKYNKRNVKCSIEYTHSRIMEKKGKINIRLCRVPEKSIRYISDFWNTLVNMRWRGLLLVIALINVVIYITFGLLFFLDAWVSGDFEKPRRNLTCLRGMNNFTSYFMLGIETITTAGNGYFRPSEFCYLVFIIFTCSTIMTIFIDGAFLSVVYAKFGQPTYKLTIFSKKAVINLRNGKLCLIIRINDILRKHWIENQVNMFYINSNTSVQSEILPNYISELEVQPYGMIFWPIEVVHEITSDSPLWNISAKDLMTMKIGKAEGEECIECGQRDTPGHSVFECTGWDTDREEFHGELGVVLTADNIINVMLRGVRSWKVVRNYIATVLETKEMEERRQENWGNSRIGKAEGEECIECGQRDTPGHSVFECTGWDTDREEFHGELGVVLTADNIINCWKRRKWKREGRKIGETLGADECPRTVPTPRLKTGEGF